MTTPHANSQRRALGLMLRGALIEAMRRRGFYVLLIFMTIYLGGIGAAAVVGVENAATATFLRNLGLELAFGLSLLATVLTAVRQVPDDMEQRTIYPLLAKPLGRGQYIAGRLLGAWLTGVLALVPLFLLGWAPATFLVPRALVEATSAGMLAQMLLLQVVALGLVAALGLFFSLWMPRGLAIVAMLLMVVQGDTVSTMAQAHVSAGPGSAPLLFLTGLLPNFELLRLTTAYTDGSPALGASSFLLRLVYAGVFALAAALAASGLFRRRAL